MMPAATVYFDSLLPMQLERTASSLSSRNVPAERRKMKATKSALPQCCRRFTNLSKCGTSRWIEPPLERSASLNTERLRSTLHKLQHATTTKSLIPQSPHQLKSSDLFIAVHSHQVARMQRWGREPEPVAPAGFSRCWQRPADAHPPSPSPPLPLFWPKPGPSQAQHALRPMLLYHGCWPKPGPRLTNAPMRTHLLYPCYLPKPKADKRALANVHTF